MLAACGQRVFARIGRIKGPQQFYVIIRYPNVQHIQLAEIYSVDHIGFVISGLHTGIKEQTGIKLWSVAEYVLTLRKK